MKRLHWDLDLLANREKLLYKNRFGEVSLHFQREETQRLNRLEGNAVFSITHLGFINYTFEQIWDDHRIQYIESDLREKKTYLWRFTQQKNSQQVIIESIDQSLCRSDSVTFSSEQPLSSIFSPLHIFYWIARGSLKTEPNSIQANVLFKECVEAVDINKGVAQDGVHLMQLKFAKNQNLLLEQSKFWLDRETQQIIRFRLGVPLLNLEFSLDIS